MHDCYVWGYSSEGGKREAKGGKEHQGITVKHPPADPAHLFFNDSRK